MSNEITKTNTPTMIDVIRDAISKPDFNSENMKALLEMQKDMMKVQAKIDFDTAMSRLQPVLPQIHKKAKGHNCTYAKYEDVDRVTRPLYTAEGFSIAYNTKGNIHYGIISHVGGHSKTVEIEFPPDTSGNKAAIQAKISSLSYAKRNLLQMLLNIVTTGEDNDGADANEVVTNEQAVEIDLLITSKKADKKKVLEYLKVPDVQSIKSVDYLKAITALNAVKVRKEGA